MTLNKFQDYTEAELRDHINDLIDQYGEGTSYVEGLLDLAKNLDIKLKPSKVEVTGRIHGYGSHAITMDYDSGMPFELPGYITDEFGMNWGGKMVKLTIEEVVD